jgi:hypothetical protein
MYENVLMAAYTGRRTGELFPNSSRRLLIRLIADTVRKKKNTQNNGRNRSRGTLIFLIFFHNL